MFYEILQDLCLKKSTTVTAVLKSLNISTSKGTAWKNGSVPNGEIIKKLAEYFEVSTDYLLGNETESKTLDEQLKGIDFALHSESKELTDGEKRDVIRFMKFMKAKRNEE